MRLSLAGWSVVGSGVLLGVAAIGCSPYRVSQPHEAVLHPFAPIPREFARVCAIRTEVYAAQLAFPTYDNGALVGVTKGATFFCYKAEPGEHTIRVDSDPPFSTELHAEAGKSYYLHERVPVELVPRCIASWVTEERAKDLVEASSYETTSVAHGEAPPDAVPYAKAASR